MCDYSLMAVPNRLAVCGEELVSHKFHTGAKGFISSAEASQLAESALRPKDWWANLWRMLKNQQGQCTAVCIPPGARLLMRGLPESLQHECEVPGESQEVVFTQTSAEIRFRDAVRFANGCEISIQKLNEGLRVKVLSLSSSEYTDPENIEFVPVRPEVRQSVLWR
jgi:hypothetical protein